MSKKSRRAQRRKRPSRNGGAFEGSTQVKISVVTAPRATGGQFDLHNDARLARAAILYADQVELVSVSGSVLAGMRSTAAAGPIGLFTLLTQVGTSIVPPELGRDFLPSDWPAISPIAQQFSTLNTDVFDMLPDALKAELRALRHIGIETLDGPKISDNIFDYSDKFSSAVDRATQRSGVDEIIPALDRGIVQFTSKADSARISPEEMRRLMQMIGANEKDPVNYRLLEWLYELRRLLNAVDTHILLDADVSRLVSEMVRESRIAIPNSALGRANRAAVGSGLVARLPAFPEAPMDELLALRDELSAPLIRYRSAIAKFTDGMQSTAIDHDFSSFIDDLWHSSVAPALLEVQETLAEHSFTREFVKGIGADLKTYLIEGAAIYAACGPVGHLPNLITSAMPIFGPLAQMTAVALSTARDERTSTITNDMFYLYEANRRLA